MTAFDTLPPCSILLLAGGQGQRMGGRDKGLIEWQGEPLIYPLHRLTRPLTDDLIISCNRNRQRYAPLADRLVHDDEPDFPGPYAGIRAGLAVARHDYLLVMPCDTPLLDVPLLDGLRRMAADHPGKPVMVRQGEQWEPLLCCIPTCHAAVFERHWQQGQRSPRRTMAELGAVALQCDPGDRRLANLNSPQVLTEVKP
ncbi:MULTISPECIES: molybdenum cofactor guanylyltransferase MobA [unclassified Pseudomonas]|uniref:molybdenum cofactor guanylyltransferase MobA n=1 Tax=unclassified Pseudomonas TaxID=196821 RepID=UPI000D385736|nr:MULTISPECIES: molybdenum cofactor guanylyltransferase MobA [unclassified Pseudomonas]RAU44354.1 molybdenum cofactor guanylyltransferase MobA [Pseudomonas sp. RIT 409]RAU50999.1 molybdenum cofactor guanylyltransferase MobA [Pseudomonas sp. RIT 412]